MFRKHCHKALLLSHVGLSLSMGAPSLEVNAGPQTHFGGFGGNAAARYWFEPNTAVQVSVGFQGADASAGRGRALVRAIVPVLLGMRYSINRGSRAVIQPHVNVGVGPYFLLSSRSDAREASASSFVNWGIRPGTGIDLNLGNEIYTAVNLGYHFVSKYEGLETTLGVGVFF